MTTYDKDLNKQLPSPLIHLVLSRLAEPKLTVGPSGVTPLYLTNSRPSIAHALRCQSSVTGFHLFTRSGLTLVFARDQYFWW